ncbi:hypothetical protein F5884DRAFT_491189 [Xylogone sp. PMI_703]|nr:hypothetical protein F5884DRAFT_491189 [Xylogone sp. PMI_703]
MASSTVTTLENPKVVRTTLNYYIDSPNNPTAFAPTGAAFFKREFNPKEVLIHDIRGREEEFALDQQGFQVCQHSSAIKDFTDRDNVKKIYYPETVELIKTITGASRVYIFSHFVRQGASEAAKAAAEKLSGDASVGLLPPARYVHIDQSAKGARDTLEFYLPEEALQLQKTRWGIINIWRPIKPVSKDPLAVCDAHSVRDEDLIPTTIKLPIGGAGQYENPRDKEGNFDNLNARAHPDHRWYYASNMKPEEVLLLKCFDSKKAEGLATRVPHTAFAIPGTENAPNRESIETRCLVFWENQLVDE